MMTTIDSPTQHISQLHNAALALMPTSNEIPPPLVDIDLPLIIRPIGRNATAIYSRTVRLERLRKPYADGKFGHDVVVDGDTLPKILANPKKWLSVLRPEDVTTAVVAWVIATNLPGRQLRAASETLWYLLAAQRGAFLQASNIGAVTIDIAGNHGRAV